MDLALTDEQELVVRTAREFAQKVLAPRAAARDVSGEFPTAELRELAGLGLLGVNVPEELGGAAAGPIAFALALAELAAADPSVSVAVSVTNMVAELIATRGSEAQRRAHVPRLVSGAALCGAFGLSEPQAGSDSAALGCRAVRCDGGFKLTGTKQWISHGDHAGVLVVWAVTEPGAGTRGTSCFIVPGGAAGLTVTRREEKMGLHGSTTCQLAFDDVFVPADAVLGELDQGFKLALAALDGGRIGIAAQAYGIARAALDGALAYARDRVTFGKPILEHQAIGNMLADGATWLEASRLLILRAAWRKQVGLPFGKEAAMAKLFATEKAGQICDLALQIHGGYGYTRDFAIERAYRDVRVTRIYEGTSEIQRIVIARNILKEVSS
jgi:alkylation response protein AidB-like acyl-CoA dehydrogenase